MEPKTFKRRFCDGVMAHVTEFPLISVMTEINKELISSSEKDFASVREKMLVTAAALQVATLAHGAYKRQP